ncbi:MAG: type I DNA topoisomerase, partial [Planctomycetes bacterium]|nr:type I DNA topoisomerase [Planctomycetota bacterium]
MSDSQPSKADIDAILEEFAGLRVSKSALEETLGIDLAKVGEDELTRMRHIIAYMRHDKLTLSRAVSAATRGTRVMKRTDSTRKRTSVRAKAGTGKGKAEKETDSGAAPEPPKRRGPRFTGKDKLLIVESPAKAKTIKKFLGGDFVVKASMGHVRDIPSRGRDRSDIGIDFNNEYQPYYVPIDSREKVIKELRTAADKSSHIYLAPDPDREGEAIAWHLKEILDLPDERVSRVTFNAITKSAVKEAMSHPAQVNMDLVNAQQGRRVLDRIVGYRLSPFLWKKVTKGLSAGRVQSVAVRLVAEREKEIQAFNTTEFWRIKAELNPAGSAKDEFQAELVGWQGSEFVVLTGDKKNQKTPTAPDEASANAIVEQLKNADFTVTDVTEREVKGRPSPPFITSSLQQAASNILRLGAQRTMRIAQQLYEGVELEGGESTGLITYMRTDSSRIAPEAIAEVRQYIGENFAPPYLPEKPNFYSSRKGAQDAHEAIRPTSVYLTPDRVKP